MRFREAQRNENTMPNQTTQGSNPTAADVRMSARDITEADAPAAYKTFRDKEDGCIKVVLKP